MMTEKPVTMEDVPPELREEFEMWERASDEDWMRFLEWERQEKQQEANECGLSSFAGE